MPRTMLSLEQALSLQQRKLGSFINIMLTAALPLCYPY